jgi:signal transduction histidine kinase
MPAVPARYYSYIRRRIRNFVFVFQAALIVLPVLILSSAALYFLREDKASAENEAREQAATVAAQLVRPLSERLSETLINGPARRGLIIHGRIQDPPDLTAPPAPPEWAERLSASDARLWRVAQEDPGQAYAALKTLTRSASAPLRANVALALLARNGAHATAAQLTRSYIDLARRYPGVPTSTGAPLDAVALLSALRASAGHPLPPEFVAVLERHAHETASFLTEQLLDESERAFRGTGLSTRVGAIRAAWDDRQSTVDALHDVLRLGIPEGAPIETWLHMRGQSILVMGDPVVGGWRIGLFQSFRDDLLNAFSVSPTVLPPYTAVRVRFAGEQIPLSSPTWPKGRLLASVPGVLRLPPPRSFTVEIEADPNALDARYRRRLWLTTGLILSTAGTAFLGLFILWQGHQRQMRLAEMKTAFVSAVSHELRAPIGALQLMAESLERGKIADPAQQKDYFRLIAQECRRLSSLVGKVLDFSRMESGRQPYTFAVLDLAPLMLHAAAVMEPLAAERGIHVNVIAPLSDLQPRWDAHAVEQALLNLLDNAIKHSPEGASVIVQAEPIESAVRLWVADSGPGIPAEEQSRIFDLFYRAGNELRRETKGVGLGLAIVKHIAEAHRGRVLVDSAPGRGCRFALELPL